ncbi:MAG: gamma-glutamyl-phosphate reductase, partial [Eubacterium sp.]|nr:gamma-glutamyl-phosphate reductase [Eubacterium sp.]
RLRGTKEVTDILFSAENNSNDIQNGSGESIGDQSSNIETISDDDFETEYLDMIVGIRLADDVDEAIEHINRHGSHHTDAIISDNNDNAARFMQMVDSAGVYHNCSTRFSDGFRYGFGAEVGISTGKLHARGPVGLEGLVSYKYELFGSGQTVTEYADGTRTFHHRDISQ